MTGQPPSDPRLERLFGGPSRCFVIAEVAQSHDGSLGAAHAFIDAAAKAGADAIKFQTHIAGAESTLDEPWRIKFSRQDATRFEYWRRMEFSEDEWVDLARHASEAGVVFLSSPFSEQAVRLLNRVGVPAWKVASGEIENPELLEAIWETKLPVFYSTGMASLKVIDRVVENTRQRGIPFALFQCTSEYPVAPERWGLQLIGELKHRYDCPVGLSDHSGSIFAGLAAVTLGATLLEVHVAFSRQMFGPDVPASVTPDELAQLVRGIRDIECALASPVDKNRQSERAATMRGIFGRSWALRADLPAGSVLSRTELVLKKPGSGIPLEDLPRLIGKRLKVDKSAVRLLRWDDLEDEG
jgi:N,N'-diacetyllegionaminate synthase